MSGPEGARALLVVQEHDTHLDQLRYRRAHLPSRDQLDATLAEQSGVEREGAELQARRDELAARQAHLEAEVSTIEKRLSDLDRQMRSGSITAARDLQAMTEQMASLRRHKDQLEDDELEVMEALEPLDARREELQGSWVHCEERAVRLRAEVAEAEVEVDGQLAAVVQARDKAAAAVAPALLATYDRLRSRLGGVGAAPLVGASCGGCHLALSASELDRIRRAPHDQLVTCEQCGRILVP